MAAYLVAVPAGNILGIEPVMIERVHEHIITELQQNARTDTVFVLTTILLNVATLATNSAIASGRSLTHTMVMIVFIALTLLVNGAAVWGLTKGKQTRRVLVGGLIKMYEDQNVAGYYDPSVLANYGTRYNLFMIIIAATGLVAVVVPLVIR